MTSNYKVLYIHILHLSVSRGAIYERLTGPYFECGLFIHQERVLMNKVICFSLFLSLHTACEKGNVECLEVLLGEQPDLSFVNKAGESFIKLLFMCI